MGKEDLMIKERPGEGKGGEQRITVCYVDVLPPWNDCSVHIL